MQLFDHGERTDLDHGKRTESGFSYLNRSARPEVAAVRALLEEWFERFPEEGKAQLRGDFRSPKPRQSLGAFWELYVHEVHRRLGYELQPHPAVLGTTRRPDFLARRGNDTFYLEATLVTLSDEEMAAYTRWNAMLELIDQVFDPDFAVSVHVKVAGMETLSKQDVVPRIEAWLASLDWVEAQAATQPVECEFPVRDWVLTLRADPKPPSGRGDPSFPTVWFTGVLRSRLDERQYLEDNLRDKSKYGEPELPFVIAALCDRSLVTDRLVEWSLYGPVAVKAPIREGVGRMEEAFLDREPRGLWQRGGEPQVTRVSAVLIAMHLGPRSVANSDLTLWKNPWAARPMTDDLPWRTVVGDLEQNYLVTIEPAKAPREVLGLDVGWPVSSAA